MNQYVNSISGRLSLRSPQRQSLEILHRIMDIVPPYKDTDLNKALKVIQSEYPSVIEFEREFTSLCFALATGVGKTRLMGAFINYLHLAHGLNNFFVLAPNLTIYNKLITDFTPNTAKYVFKGIAEFSINPPAIITGDNYESLAGSLLEQLIRCKINIFNISKINYEVRGGNLPKIKRLSEYIGQSYFDYLAELDDLVLLMDESHRYRGSAGVRAINELKPVLGIELTATPFVKASKDLISFKNVVFDYPLGQAMDDGFVKEPAVVTRKDFVAIGKTREQIEYLKLEDGIRLHESVKVELGTYALETENRIVKPFILVIARDTTHAGELLRLIQSDSFFEGRYKEKVIQVDSSQTGAAEEEMITRLLAVENPEEPTEIVVHVNMLKEGWDVHNLYTIVPLRAAHARILIEQSIGRGLRLPYGKRTGISALDRLSIVAHDKFQEIIDEANRPDSKIRLKQLILDGEELDGKTVTVVSQPNVTSALGVQSSQEISNAQVNRRTLADWKDKIASIGDKIVSIEEMEEPVFELPEEQEISRITYNVIRKYEAQPQKTPTIHYLQNEDIQKDIVNEVNLQFAPAQIEFEEVIKKPDVATIVAKTTKIFIKGTIDIPRITVAPKGEVCVGFKAFKLDLSSINYKPPSEELWIQALRTGQREILGLKKAYTEGERPEDHIVNGLVEFDDIAYDDHADLLYDLAGQVVEHFKKHLNEEETKKVLRYYQSDLSRFIHDQMENHRWEKAEGYDTVISKGFCELRPSAYTALANNTLFDFRQPPKDKKNIKKYLYRGFQKCLYPVQKFYSDSERQLSVILEREAEKWFMPARGQFQILYKVGTEHFEYQPDFVAEIKDCIYMLESKASNQMEDPVVLIKKEAAKKWCNQASNHAKGHGGKPWNYVLIPHNAIAENMTIKGFEKQFA